MTSTPVYENISIEALLHLPPKAIWALIWRRAQANAFIYQQEFDDLGKSILEKKIQKGHVDITQEVAAYPLPLDEQKRPYVSINNFILSTTNLVELVVQQFHTKLHFYPETIYLSPRRWTIGKIMKYYIVKGLKIPYALGSEEYDVRCVGAPLQS
jgi:hypothetical protein